MKTTKTSKSLTIILLQKKGGKTSARIIEHLLIRPYNSNQIANLLNISYNTAYYHFQMMMKLDLVIKVPTKYGTFYMANENLIKEKDSFE